MSPSSGGRHASKADAVAQQLALKGIDVAQRGRNTGESTELAAHVVAAGFDVLAGMAGDGIVRLALQSVAYSRTTLGIFDTGTGRDVARHAGVPRSEPLVGASVILDDRTRTLDLARTGAPTTRRCSRRASTTWSTREPTR